MASACHQHYTFYGAHCFIQISESPQLSGQPHPFEYTGLVSPWNEHLTVASAEHHHPILAHHLANSANCYGIQRWSGQLDAPPGLIAHFSSLAGVCLPVLYDSGRRALTGDFISS